MDKKCLTYPNLINKFLKSSQLPTIFNYDGFGNETNHLIYLNLDTI